MDYGISLFLVALKLDDPSNLKNLKATNFKHFDPLPQKTFKAQNKQTEKWEK